LAEQATGAAALRAAALVVGHAAAGRDSPIEPRPPGITRGSSWRRVTPWLPSKTSRGKMPVGHHALVPLRRVLLRGRIPRERRPALRERCLRASVSEPVRVAAR